MRCQFVIAVIASIGCGRWSFDPVERSADAPPDLDAPDVDAPPCTVTPPVSWAVMNPGAYATAMPIRIAANPPDAMLSVTTDGTDPTPATATATGTVEVSFVSGTPVKYMAVNGCAAEAAHSDLYTVDTTQQTMRTFEAWQVSLGNDRPLAVVTAGGTINGSAMLQIWSRTGCPNCIIQLVYGIENTAADCAINAVVGAWPGTTAPITLSLTAPASPGVYAVYGLATAQAACNAAALSEYNASAVSIGLRIGIVVVTP